MPYRVCPDCGHLAYWWRVLDATEDDPWEQRPPALLPPLGWYQCVREHSWSVETHDAAAALWQRAAAS